MKKNTPPKPLLKMLLLWVACQASVALQAQLKPSAGPGQPGSAARDTSFSWQASLDSIPQAAFYKIVLPPAILSRCKPDLADLRIEGPNGQFVPYVLRTDLPVSSAEGFSEFPILPAAPADTTNDLQIANWSAEPVSSLLLFLRNTAETRHITLSGSDDRKKWFLIKEHIPLDPSTADSGQYSIQRIGFPASNYRYFKLIQENKTSLPVSIIKAGIATRQFTTGKYQPIPSPAITQYDSSYHTYVRLSYSQPFVIDQIDLEIQGPALYKREARIYTPSQPYPDISFTVDPHHHLIQFPSLKTSVIIVDISNEDNTPLVVRSAATTQLQRYLITWLQPGAGYRLLAGNTDATAPVYDLKYFVDSLSKPPLELEPGIPQPIGKIAAPPKTKDHAGLLLWIVIGAVLLLLIVLCAKMLKAIPAKNHDSQQ